MTTILFTIAAIFLLHTSGPGLQLLTWSERLPRSLFTFVNCPQCLGFWTAAVLAWFEIPTVIQIPVYTAAILTLLSIIKHRYYDEGTL